MPRTGDAPHPTFWRRRRHTPYGHRDGQHNLQRSNQTSSIGIQGVPWSLPRQTRCAVPPDNASPPTSRVQTKRTSSAQHNRVYFVGACKRGKQACLSRCGSTSTNIQPSRRASIANDNRTPCSRAEVFCLSNSDIFNILGRNLPHGVSFYIRLESGLIN